MNRILIALFFILMLQSCNKPVEKKLNSDEQTILFEKIVCSRGPRQISNIELRKNRTFILNGYPTDTIEYYHNKIPHYYKGKLSYFSYIVIINELLNSGIFNNQLDFEENFLIGPDWTCIKIYSKHDLNMICGNEFSPLMENFLKHLFEIPLKEYSQKIDKEYKFETFEFVNPMPPKINKTPIDETL